MTEILLLQDETTNQQNKTTTVGKKTIDSLIALCEYKP
jgi:hypothetical protein